MANEKHQPRPELYFPKYGKNEAVHYGRRQLREQQGFKLINRLYYHFWEQKKEREIV
jgi:hypothetical protein